MEEQKNFFAELRKVVGQYIQNRLLLIRLQTVEQTSRLIAVLSTTLLIAALSFFVMFFLSFMAGYYFAYLTGSLYWGFGIVAAFYIVVLVIIVLIRKKVLEKNIINAVIQIFMDKTAESNDTNTTE